MPAPTKAGAPAPVVTLPVGSSGRVKRAQRVVIYGPGGIGKSTLASLAPSPLFLDTDHESDDLDVSRINITGWRELREAIRAPTQAKTLVIDNLSKTELLAVAYTLDTIKHEKGHAVDKLEGYGFGKGYRHVFDTWLPLLPDLDQAVDRGVNVVLVAHAAIERAPNPAGDDYIRYEPRLQRQANGPILYRTFEWADHVLFLGYDIAAADGKARGNGTRTIYPQELPTHMAKSRRLRTPKPWNDPTDGSIWSEIL